MTKNDFSMLSEKGNVQLIRGIDEDITAECNSRDLLALSEEKRRSAAELFLAEFVGLDDKS
ncbi:hypothetical protein [Pelagibacterium luteolum]|uniref:hypothetical protein n=1 Tax=Pelagibacterium luteolum TaxID=440168 RepID=UPI00115F85FB|nr:hypothetical protein [Pelagibacterium luteolum]